MYTMYMIIESRIDYREMNENIWVVGNSYKV